MSDRIPTPARLDAIRVQALRYLDVRRRSESADVQILARLGLSQALKVLARYPGPGHSIRP